MTAKLPNQVRVSNMNKLELCLLTLLSGFLPSSVVLISASLLCGAFLTPPLAPHYRLPDP